MTRIVFLALALIFGLGLAGCIAPARATGNSYDVRVTAEPGGPGIAGATVLASYQNGWFGGEDEAITDAAGVAHLRATAPLAITVSAPGFVTEHVRHGAHEVALYHEHLVLTMRGTLKGADADTHDLGVDRWDAHEVPFGGTPAAHAGYGQRVLLVNATLAWNNSLLSTGDLALAFGHTSDRFDIYRNGQEQTVEQGPQTESAQITPGDMGRAGWSGATTLFAGAAPGRAYATASGMAYTITIDAFFGQPRDSPNAPMGAILALAAAALMLARKK